MQLLAAPDKFRGSLGAADVARAIAAGAAGAGWTTQLLPLADGGEGMLDAFGGPNRTTQVLGPLSTPIDAAWRLDGERAVIEMSRASGLSLAGGASGNDPLAATTYGTGELILAAIEAGATEIVVGVGGSASTDGGLGAVEALAGLPFSASGVTVEVACDVTTTFLDAPRVYGPQKGADEDQVAALEDRLRALALRYVSELGVDVRERPRSGAAGGLAGGLAALGAELLPGFALIAEAVGLDRAIAGIDRVVTGEGSLDATSFQGKVVGELAARAGRQGVPLLAVVGEDRRDLVAETPCLTVVSLVRAFGSQRAFAETGDCIAEVVRSWLDDADGPIADPPDPFE